MNSQTYRKRPVEVQAVQHDGTQMSALEICGWIHSGGGIATPVVSGEVAFVVISTLEGQMITKPDDYVIRGVEGEHYPCKPDIFKSTYEKVEQ